MQVDTVRRVNVTSREVGSSPSYYIRFRSIVVNALPCHGRDRGFDSLRDRLLVYMCEHPPRGIHILGKVAQSVEYRFEAPRVVGSIPILSILR